MHEALQFFIYLRSSVVLALLATLASLASIVLLSVLLQRNRGSLVSSGSSLCPAPSANDPASTITTSYLCKIPADSYRTIAYSQLWIALGDSFAAGAGVQSTSNWLALLQSTAQLHIGSRPTLLNIAASAQGDSLAQQLAALQQSADYARLLQSGDSALVFVSYGTEQMQADGAQANVGALADELDALFVAPVNRTAAPFRVLLLLRPDPVHGGVRIPPALATCPTALHSLNYPSVDSVALHRSIYAAQRSLYETLQRKYQCALVDVDAALGAFAWPMALTRSACAFADCESYNALGHTMLANLLWSCMLHKVYNATI